MRLYFIKGVYLGLHYPTMKRRNKIGAATADGGCSGARLFMLLLTGRITISSDILYNYKILCNLIYYNLMLQWMSKIWWMLSKNPSIHLFFRFRRFSVSGVIFLSFQLFVCVILSVHMENSSSCVQLVLAFCITQITLRATFIFLSTQEGRTAT